MLTKCVQKELLKFLKLKAGLQRGSEIKGCKRCFKDGDAGSAAAAANKCNSSSQRTPCISRDWPAQAAARFEGTLQALSQSVQTSGSLTLAVGFGSKLAIKPSLHPDVPTGKSQLSSLTQTLVSGLLQEILLQPVQKGNHFRKQLKSYIGTCSKIIVSFR